MPATRCPHCQTRFRVTPAQLALRAGMVRCGACREIFNGDQYLLQDPAEVDALASSADDSGGRMTLIDFGSLRAGQPAVTPTMQDELDELSKAIADLQAKPWRDTPAVELAAELGSDPADDRPPVAPAPAPAFVAQARKRQQSAGRWKLVLWLGIPLLLVALAAQLGYFFRSEIAARSPEAGRYLRAACARLGCQIRLPEHIELLSLEFSQLQEAPGRVAIYVLTALIRNQADTAQAWPALDLQLKTDVGQILVRKVFEPVSYLNPADLKKGFAAHAEHEIQISFELSGDHPGGFSVTLFHH